MYVQVHTGAKLNAENGRKQRKETSSSSLEKCVKNGKRRLREDG